MQMLRIETDLYTLKASILALSFVAVEFLKLLVQGKGFFGETSWPKSISINHQPGNCELNLLGGQVKLLERSSSLCGRV